MEDFYMIIYDKNDIKRVDSWKDESIYVLMDFDRTITNVNSEASWGILSKSPLVSPDYVSERQELFDFYRPIEIDENMEDNIKSSYMHEWWEKHINLLIKHKISIDMIDDAVSNIHVMEFRDGAYEFLNKLNKRNIPIIIISAGMGDFVKHCLIKNNCYFDNIHIVSNFLTFENGMATGISGDIIHSLNKNSASIPLSVKQLISDRSNIILFGDVCSDVKMANDEDRENAFKIGFLDINEKGNMESYKMAFDVVCTNNTNYNDLMDEFGVLGRSNDEI